MAKNITERYGEYVEIELNSGKLSKDDNTNPQ